MWKRILAIIAIPVATLLSVSMVEATWISLPAAPEGAGLYRVMFFVGMGTGALVTAVLLFLWWRWIWQTLRQPRTPPPSI
jgi:hypothetical protein